jgi:hypothetical protein
VNPRQGDVSAVAGGSFSEAEPDLAGFGLERLTSAPAYLATIRSFGAPRVHPVTPIFTATGFFVFMEPTSPKGRDLRERKWFAMHNGVPDNAGTGGEFHVAGRAENVDDRERWSEVAAAASYTPADRHVLFELRLTEARCLGYGDVPLPDTRKWSLGS